MPEGLTSLRRQGAGEGVGLDIEAPERGRLEHVAGQGAAQVVGLKLQPAQLGEGRPGGVKGAGEEVAGQVCLPEVLQGSCKSPASGFSAALVQAMILGHCSEPLLQ